MNLSLMQLLIPVVVGGLLAWIASGIIHMLIKYHNADYKQLSNEEEITGAISKGSPATGFYSFPFCVDMAEMKNEAVQQKFARGPVGFLTILPNGMPQMGKLMGQQIAYFIAGCLLIAYCASLVLMPGAQYMTVFRFVSSVGFLTFGWAVIPYSIWYGHAWSTTAKYLLDALIYSIVVAGVFAWLWPAAG